MSVALQSLDARGVRFAAATQDLDTGTATGKLLVNLLGSFGEIELQLTSERIKEGIARSSKKIRPAAKSRGPTLNGCGQEVRREWRCSGAGNFTIGCVAAC